MSFYPQDFGPSILPTLSCRGISIIFLALCYIPDKQKYDNTPASLRIQLIHPVMYEFLPMGPIPPTSDTQLEKEFSCDPESGLLPVSP